MTQPNNYISPLPPQEQKALYRWYTLSACLVIMLVAILALINAYQYITIRNLRTTYQAMHQSLQKLQHETHAYEQHKQEYELLGKRATKMQALQQHNQVFNPLAYLYEITQNIPGNACLTELNCSKKRGTSFQGYAHTAESVIAFVTKLQQIPHMKELQLASLSPIQSQETGKTWYQFHVKNN